jgi:hypothetical protein
VFQFPTGNGLEGSVVRMECPIALERLLFALGLNNLPAVWNGCRDPSMRIQTTDSDFLVHVIPFVYVNTVY